MQHYEWNINKFKASAEDAGRVCSELEKEGKLTPDELVAVSKSEDAPLHNDFEWDDSIAAGKYRIHQARQIIDSIRVVVVEDTSPKDAIPITVNAFTSVKSSGERTYVNTVRAIVMPNYRDQIIESALNDLTAFENKYKGIKELANTLSIVSNAREDLKAWKISNGSCKE